MKVSTRLGSMILDHFIMSLIITMIAFPVLFVGFDDSFGAEIPCATSTINWTLYIMIFASSLYFNKDIIQGKSIAKRILNIEVVDIKTGEVASSLKCLIRNLTIVIWPIEIIVVLVSPSRRIGDFLAGTRIEFSSENRNSKPRVNIKNLILSVILAFMILYISLFLFKDKFGSNIFSKPNYDPMSYSKELSSKLENHLENVQSNYIMDTHIKIYNKMIDDSLKYIVATIYLKDNYIEYSSQFAEIKQDIFNSMFKIVPKSDFVLLGKFVYDDRSVSIATKSTYDWRYID